ncbi:MAG: nitrate reductase molybdenum cofactor assembly chaperone [Brevundimonas sp.]|nr:nitrate reductase molybdenum cofactor assembly chaperone [Brevundimonas sp.]
MIRSLRALSVLLAYPSDELKSNVGEIRTALAVERLVPPEGREALEPLLTALETRDLYDLQEAYSDLFDRSRKLSLHLFEHVHGDSRDRGPAMVDLGQTYFDRGFAMTVSELPDYLPLYLEFLACQPFAEARELLGEPAHVLAALQQRLAERDSPYAGVFTALLGLAEAKPDAEALKALLERTAEDVPDEDIDDEWREAPVTFGRPDHEAGGPTGLIAKIRAGRRSARTSDQEA